MIWGSMVQMAFTSVVKRFIMVPVGGAASIEHFRALSYIKIIMAARNYG